MVTFLFWGSTRARIMESERKVSPAYWVDSDRASDLSVPSSSM